MLCPNCKSCSTAAIGTAQKDDYRRRRYKCVMCDFRFTTKEVVVPDRYSKEKAEAALEGGDEG